MTSSGFVARLSRPRDACSQSRRGLHCRCVPSRHPGPAIDGRDPGLPGTPRRLVWAAVSWSGLRPRRRSPDSGMAPRHSAGYGPRTSCEKAHRPLGQLGSAGLARPPKPPAPTDGTCLRSAESRTRTCRMNEPLPRTLPMLPPDESRSGGADGAADRFRVEAVAPTPCWPRSLAARSYNAQVAVVGHQSGHQSERKSKELESSGAAVQHGRHPRAPPAPDLITRRSRVRIPPPLCTKGPLMRAFRVAGPGAKEVPCPGYVPKSSRSRRATSATRGRV